MVFTECRFKKFPYKAKSQFLLVIFLVHRMYKLYTPFIENNTVQLEMFIFCYIQRQQCDAN